MTAFALPTAEHKLSLLLGYYSMNAVFGSRQSFSATRSVFSALKPCTAALQNSSNVLPLKLHERLMLHTIEVSVLPLHKLQRGEESRQPKALSCVPEHLQRYKAALPLSMHPCLTM